MTAATAPARVRLPLLHESPAARRTAPIATRDGRTIGYLRLSLTAACAMKCLYCRPATFANPRHENRLTPREIEQLGRHLVRRHGLHKVRLTGGDPTSRPDLVEIIERLASIAGLRDLAMTTNGLTLASHARDYAKAGLRRVNVSLDSLNRETFRKLTGVDGLDRVLLGIDAAHIAGLGPIKLNTVVVRGQNDSCLGELIGFAASQRIEVRFIELMPMGPLVADWAERYVPEREMRRTLAATIARYDALPQGSDAARRYRATLHDGRVATVGFITPMSCNFCGVCDRVRIGADGTLYPCLMDRPTGSLLSAIRPRFDPDRFDALLTLGFAAKAPEHPAVGFGVMTGIGG